MNLGISPTGKSIQNGTGHPTVQKPPGGLLIDQQNTGKSEEEVKNTAGGFCGSSDRKKLQSLRKLVN